MSIIKKRFSFAALIGAHILLSAIFSAAQNIEARIEIILPATLKIEGRLTGENANQAAENWAFRRSVAGVENLGARVSNFALADRQNHSIAVKKLADGEYLANEKAAGFSYQVDLPPPNIAAMAHVSWLASEQGILMLDDLLPQIAERQTVAAQIEFDFPADWKIISGEKNVGEKIFYIENIEKAVFAVGSGWREEKIQIGDAFLHLAISGERQFSDAEAAKMVREIYGEYLKLFGESPTGKAQIFWLRAAPETRFGRWAAETRGANTTIISGEMPFKTQSLQLFHEQLRHELFHLWIPNKLALTGNYDWFYEGFTIYQALRTGVALNQIRFEDFLETLAQAYRIDAADNRRISLIEASKNRWSERNNQVYARGLLTAFLCDVALRQANRGDKHSITKIFQEVYRKHRTPNRAEDGNAAILKILKNYPVLTSTIEKYISGAEKINWRAELESIGVEIIEETGGVRLKVKAKPSGKQKDLLNELGYNNWRKMSEKRK